MLTLKTWKHTDIDPVAGLAQFDGMVFETDSVADPRNDRVMPIIEEEQPLMCRLMLDRLEPGTIVLDVGTGSGVLGLWAASKKGCRVVAIDISKRAIEFAVRNADRNRVNVASEPSLLREGQIFFRHISFEELVADSEKQMQFDVVLLNPPFNPTCPGMRAALHASAGADGQAAFRSQVALVPSVLRTCGFCIGYQMSLDVTPPKIAALEEIRRAFNQHCSISFAHVLRDSCFTPARAFLASQYRRFVAREDSLGDPAAPTIQAYIDSVAPPGSAFSLIYYEVRKEPSPISSEPTEVLMPGLPSRSWLNRIWLHRCIVENSGIA